MFYLILEEKPTLEEFRRLTKIVTELNKKTVSDIFSLYRKALKNIIDGKMINFRHDVYHGVTNEYLVTGNYNIRRHDLKYMSSLGIFILGLILHYHI